MAEILLQWNSAHLPFDINSMNTRFFFFFGEALNKWELKKNKAAFKFKDFKQSFIYVSQGGPGGTSLWTSSLATKHGEIAWKSAMYIYEKKKKNDHEDVYSAWVTALWVLLMNTNSLI